MIYLGGDFWPAAEHQELAEKLVLANHGAVITTFGFEKAR